MFRPLLLSAALFPILTGGASFADERPWYRDVDPLAGNWYVTAAVGHEASETDELIVSIRPHMETVCEVVGDGCIYRIEYSVQPHREMMFRVGVTDYGVDHDWSEITAIDVSPSSLRFFRGTTISPRLRQVEMTRSSESPLRYSGTWHFINIHGQRLEGLEQWSLMTPRVDAIGLSVIRPWNRRDVVPPSSVHQLGQDGVAHVTLQDRETYDWSDGRENPLWNQSRRAHFRVFLYGENLRGPQHITFPESVDFQIVNQGDLRSEPYADGSRDYIGKYVDVILWGQARPGLHQLRVNDQYVPFLVEIPSAEQDNGHVIGAIALEDLIAELPGPARLAAGQLADSAEPSADLRPAEPPLRPERFAQLTLAAAPEFAGTPLRVALEGRHRAFPEGDELVTAIPALFPIEGAGCQLPEDAAESALICNPDASGHARFAIETPVAGFLHWDITDAGTGAPVSDGLLEVRFEADGTGAGGGSEEAHAPTILQVLTVYPQLGLSDLDDFATRYPDPSDPLSGGTGGTRHLMVIGRDLPQSAAETDLTDTPTILYSFAESPESVGAQFEHSMLREGLSRLAGDAVGPEDVRAALRESGLDVIILRADLRPGVLPGAQTVTLNGTQATWQLRFGNLTTVLDFVRASGDADRPWERVSETPGQEVLSLRLQVSPGTVPYGEVPARVAFEDPESGAEQALDLVLSPQTDGVWLSPPFGIGVPANGGDGTPRILDPGAAEELIVTGAIAEEFALQRMPAAIGQRGALLYFPTEVQRPFSEDLETAARCSGLRPGEWTLDQLANSLTAFDDGDPFTNFIITMGADFDDLVAGGNVTQDVLVGHHAALLGLRRAMLVHGAERAESLRAVLDDPAERLAMTAAWQREWQQITSDDPQSPLFRIPVPAEPIAETLPFGRLLSGSDFYADALRDAGFDEARILAFFEEAGHAAISGQLDALDEARTELRNLDPCDLPGMMRFARNARAYAEAEVIPRLMQSDGRQFAPDTQARRWLRSAIGVADTWHAQIRASEADSDAVSFYISVVTLPLAPFELGVISSALMVQNVADMALNTASLGMRYAAAQDELRLALGLAPLLGEARLDAADAERPSFAGFVAQTGLNLVSLGFDVAAIGRAQALGALAEATDAAGDATRTVTRISPEGIGALAELRDALLLERRARLAPDPPERIALTTAQNTRLAALGSDAGGLPRLFPFVSDAPTFSLADRLDGTGLEALEAIDSRLEDLVIDLAEDDLAALFALQTRQILRDPGVAAGTRASLTDVIAQAAYRPELDFRVHLELGPSALGDVRAFGIDWDPVAIVVHEAGHIAQLRFGEAAGLVVGRVVRELDSSLRMVVVQNALARAGTGAQAISTRDALRFAFGYAVDTQAKSLRNLATGSYFQTPGRQFDGLFQVDAAEAIARARAALPDASEREILEAYIEAHTAAERTYGAELAQHASWGQLGSGARWRDMVRDAEARLAALPPP
ncbi:hypothetical protein HKCCSP123_08320 [Rhodobacterales bacterium HKCCSP123]|nr:hypothetical protein [Rhodobacterales bacterium HKCCSP123]